MKPVSQISPLWRKVMAYLLERERQVLKREQESNQLQQVKVRSVR